MTETSHSIHSWGSKTFGDAASVKAYAIRAQEELAELIAAIEDGEPNKNIALEAADVTIILHRITGTLGLELYNVVDEKMTINRERDWIPDGNGLGSINSYALNLLGNFYRGVTACRYDA